MTIIINIGAFGGFYITKRRICLGFIAISYYLFDIDKPLAALVDQLKTAEDTIAKLKQQHEQT